jgi:uncharacterized membrane protein HdeD (DUF308 family)
MIMDTTFETPLAHRLDAMLFERWWLFTVRGLAAILFGILTFMWPGASLLALIVLFGVWALVDGVLAIAAGIKRAREHQPWGWLTFEGLAGIAAGVLTFAWPGMTAIALLVVIGAWSLMTGIAEISTAIRLRKVIQHEWLLAFAGVLSIAFGVLLLLYPGAGALGLILWIGVYAIAFGVSLIAFSLRLRSAHHHLERGPIVGGGVPTPA